MEKRHAIILTVSLAIIIMLILLLSFSDLVGRHEQRYALVTFGAEEPVSFDCEVAETDLEKTVGLMNREELGEGQGMLFVYEDPHTLSFWMKNMLIPIDIIFINETGHVLNIEEAMPEPGVSDALLQKYISDGPAKWVVEVNIGVCAEKGIVPGTLVTIEMM